MDIFSVNYHIHFILVSLDFIFLGTYQAPKVGADDKHRLIFLLYQSNEQITSKSIIEQEDRHQFPLKQFVEDNKLTLVSATAFTIDGTVDK